MVLLEVPHSIMYDKVRNLSVYERQKQGGNSSAPARAVAFFFEKQGKNMT